jgi:hypothetical protein
MLKNEQVFIVITVQTMDGIEIRNENIAKICKHELTELTNVD